MAPVPHGDYGGVYPPPRVWLPRHIRRRRRGLQSGGRFWLSASSTFWRPAICSSRAITPRCRRVCSSNTSSSSNTSRAALVSSAVLQIGGPGPNSVEGLGGSGDAANRIGKGRVDTLAGRSDRSASYPMATTRLTPRPGATFSEPEPGIAFEELGTDAPRLRRKKWPPEWRPTQARGWFVAFDIGARCH